MLSEGTGRLEIKVGQTGMSAPPVSTRFRCIPLKILSPDKSLIQSRLRYYAARIHGTLNDGDAKTNGSDAGRGVRAGGAGGVRGAHPDHGHDPRFEAAGPP